MKEVRDPAEFKNVAISYTPYPQTFFERTLSLLTNDCRRTSFLTLTIHDSRALSSFKSSLKFAQFRANQVHDQITRLEIKTDINHKGLIKILKALPHLEELSIPNNASIVICPILNVAPLKSLTIESGYVYFDEGELNLIRNKFPERDFNIILSYSILPLHEPTTGSIIINFFMMLVFCCFAVYLINVEEMAIRANSPDMKPIKIPASKLWFPLLLLAGTLFAYIHYLSYISETSQARQRFITRQKPVQINNHPNRPRRKDH